MNNVEIVRNNEIENLLLEMSDEVEPSVSTSVNRSLKQA